MDDGALVVKARWLDNLWSDMKKILPYMGDKSVTDVFCLESGELVVSRMGRGKERTGVFLTGEEVKRIILSAAAVLDKKLAADRCLVRLEGVLPKCRARITGVMGEAVCRPLLTLRLPATKTFSLEDYVKGGRMSKGDFRKVLRAIESRRNILISGSTGSGKTTFFNAVLAKMAELSPDDNFYIVEDVPELVCGAEMKSRISVPPEEAADAVRLAMRWTPDRILFGELRYGEVADELLKAWNTGHTGNATTIHADSAASSISRAARLLQEVYQQMDVRVLRATVMEAVHLCVHLTKKAGFGPMVDEAVETGEMKTE